MAARSRREDVHRSQDLAGTEIGVARDPVRELLQARYRDEYQSALEAALAALDDDDRSLLRRHVVQGRSIDDLAAELGVHRSTAARRVKAAEERVAEAIRRRLCERLRLTPAEVDSLAGDVRSGLHVSVETYFRSR
jgi:RNA polymerase sigma-70 factor (ECF subfamily)